jgi:hypothetical protein
MTSPPGEIEAEPQLPSGAPGEPARRIESLRVVSVAERVSLRDKGKPGWQDFFNYISVGIIAKSLVSQPYQPFFGQLLDDLWRKSTLPQRWPHPKIQHIPKAD